MVRSINLSTSAEFSMHWYCCPVGTGLMSLTVAPALYIVFVVAGAVHVL